MVQMDIHVLGAFGDCESFLKELPKLKVDVALMDIGLPGMNGIEGVKKARSNSEKFKYFNAHRI